MVTKMAAGVKRVPLEHCPFIQEFTAGAVTCEELRPDEVEYFALIRAQSGAAPTTDSQDRRDPANSTDFPDLDRRAPTVVGG